MRYHLDADHPSAGIPRLQRQAVQGDGGGQERGHPRVLKGQDALARFT
jgi:hypothetical protein